MNKELTKKSKFYKYCDSSIVNNILNTSPSIHSHLHGIGHWERVLNNYLLLAKHYDISESFGAYFALFHDSRRQTDGICKIHGEKVAEYLWDSKQFHKVIGKEYYNILTTCSLHTLLDPRISTYKHLPLEWLCCLDADRLDINRVYPQINLDQLFTNEGKRLAGIKNGSI